MTDKILIIGPAVSGFTVGDIFKLNRLKLVPEVYKVIEVIPKRSYEIEPFIRSPKEKPYNGAPVSARDIKKFHKKR